MREIKFRAWDGELMHNVAELVFDKGPNLDGKGIRFYGPGVGQGRVDGKNNILMQYTGLTDKNGREIYDGDILKRRVHVVMYGTDLNEWVDEVVEVKWREDYAGYFVGERPLYAEVDATTDHITLCNCTKFEVIGNVYENPELLECEE